MRPPPQAGRSCAQPAGAPSIRARPAARLGAGTAGPGIRRRSASSICASVTMAQGMAASTRPRTSATASELAVLFRGPAATRPGAGVLRRGARLLRRPRRRGPGQAHGVPLRTGAGAAAPVADRARQRARGRLRDRPVPDRIRAPVPARVRHRSLVHVPSAGASDRARPRPRERDSLRLQPRGATDRRRLHRLRSLQQRRRARRRSRPGGSRKRRAYSPTTASRSSSRRTNTPCTWSRISTSSHSRSGRCRSAGGSPGGSGARPPSRARVCVPSASCGHGAGATSRAITST